MSRPGELIAPECRTTFAPFKDGCGGIDMATGITYIWEGPNRHDVTYS